MRLQLQQLKHWLHHLSQFLNVEHIAIHKDGLQLRPLQLRLRLWITLFCEFSSKLTANVLAHQDDTPCPSKKDLSEPHTVV